MALQRKTGHRDLTLVCCQQSPSFLQTLILSNCETFILHFLGIFIQKHRVGSKRHPSAHSFTPAIRAFWLWKVSQIQWWALSYPQPFSSSPSHSLFPSFSNPESTGGDSGAVHSTTPKTTISVCLIDKPILHENGYSNDHWNLFRIAQWSTFWVFCSKPFRSSPIM